MSDIPHIMVMVMMIIFLTTVPAAILISLYIKFLTPIDKYR